MEKINEYFKNPAVSNSMLGMMNNPRLLKIKKEHPDMEGDDKKHYRIGGGLDCLLTSAERFEYDYAIISVERPMGLMGKFIDSLPLELDQFSDKELYLEAYEKSGYKMNLERVIKNLWENDNNRIYYNVTKTIANDKIIISQDEYEIINKCRELLLANEYVKPYFVNTNPNIELHLQVPIYFKHKQTDCKALLDGVIVDHVNRTIQPYDLKTIGKSVYTFENSMMEYGYYRQCAFYEIAVFSDESPFKKYIDEGYEVLDFIFIVVETKLSSTHPAVIYKTNKADRQKGIMGGYRNGRWYKGINELMDAWKYHTENDYWDLPLDLKKNEGIIDLKLFD